MGDKAFCVIAITFIHHLLNFGNRHIINDLYDIDSIILFYGAYREKSFSISHGQRRLTQIIKGSIDFLKINDFITYRVYIRFRVMKARVGTQYSKCKERNLFGEAKNFGFQ